MDETERRPEKKKTAAITSKNETVSSTKPNLPLIIGTGVAFLVIVILVFVFTGGKDEVIHEQSNAVSATLSDTPAQKLIDNFLTQNKWRQEYLDSFLAEWSALGDLNLEQIQQTTEYGQITNAIYKRLLEERALAGLSSSSSGQDKQQMLVNFAQQLGISDSRISL